MTYPQVSIDEFVAGLKAIPEFTPRSVFPYIKTRPVRFDSLQNYLLFNPTSYTRNLVYKNDVFELLVLCWEVGQASRIHNHRDQNCWMAVPAGQLKNQNYRVFDRDPAMKTCRLVPGKASFITPTDPLEVDQGEPAHQVMNLREFGERAVSLHVYSKPFSTCEVYNPDRGTYAEVELHYTTEHRRQGR